MDVFTCLFSGGVLGIIFAIRSGAKVVVFCAEIVFCVCLGHYFEAYALIFPQHFDQLAGTALRLQNAVMNENHLGFVGVIQ